MINILEINNLSKSYQTLNGEINAIGDISLTIKDKEFLCIVGSSGCGKSTLLNILAKLEMPTKGKIIEYKSNLKIGYMFQDDALLPWLTILENACIGLDINHNKTKENIEYVKDLLDTYGLKDFINKYPSELSGGMKQRVALIRTLAIKPDVLLLDEPFSALDYQSRLKVADDVYKIIKKEQKTVIMITHDIAEAISLSDRIVLLSKRPARIKNIYKIDFDEKNIYEKRNNEQFMNYYDKIWKDLDINV